MYDHDRFQRFLSVRNIEINRADIRISLVGFSSHAPSSRQVTISKNFIVSIRSVLRGLFRFENCKLESSVPGSGCSAPHFFRLFNFFFSLSKTDANRASEFRADRSNEIRTSQSITQRLCPCLIFGVRDVYGGSDRRAKTRTPWFPNINVKNNKDGLCLFSQTAFAVSARIYPDNFLAQQCFT